MDDTYRDRRKHPRVSVPATLTLARGTSYIGTYTLHDVSQGGARLFGKPPLELGEELDVLLHLPGCDGIALTAEVVHRILPPEGAPSVGLRFLHASDVKESEVAEAILRVLVRMARNKDRAVLVADDSEEVRNALRRELELLGWNVVQASCFDEARETLEESYEVVDIALVDLYLGSDDPMALMSLLKSSFPSIRRVLMSGQTRTGELHMIASAIPAHDVLTKPWDSRQLAKIAMA